MDNIFNPSNLNLQDQFGTRALADRIQNIIVHDRITPEDRAFIESREMFFITTIDESGMPTVSYKGGKQGFLTVVDEQTIAFPGYDGNGMFLTAGNITSNNKVGLLLIDFENPHRTRIHGTATVSSDDALMNQFHEAQYIIRIKISNMFINCPRYIHKHKKIETSQYVPSENTVTPDPEWKKMDVFQDVLPSNE